MNASSEILDRIEAVYRLRDEQLAKRDFKGASESHFEFHRLVYIAWPAIYRGLSP